MVIEQNAIGLQFHVLVLKKHLLKHPSPFHDGAREWYIGKAIEHPHLYTYEVCKLAPSLYFPAPNVATTLALRRFIRGIFAPF